MYHNSVDGLDAVTHDYMGRMSTIRRQPKYNWLHIIHLWVLLLVAEQVT